MSDSNSLPAPVLELAAAQRQHPPSAAAIARAKLPTLQLSGDEHGLNVAAAKHLATHPDIFQRGDKLVHVVQQKKQAKLSVRGNGAACIGVLPQALLRSWLTEVVRFEKFLKKEQVWVEDHPWDFLVKAVSEMKSWEDIRPLEMVVEYPVMRTDGSLIEKPGYDPDSGILYAPRGALPLVKQKPTRDDAVRAGQELVDLVSDFPFAEEADKSVWLAGLLTPIARPGLDSPTPMFAADGNMPGSGKGFVMDAIPIILAARGFARQCYTTDDAEMRKLVTTIAASGFPLVLFDNVDKPLGGAAIDAALTSTDWTDRLLSTNTALQAPLVTNWYATGNNLQFGGDFHRRVLLLRLRSKVEKPEERTGFKYPRWYRHLYAERVRLLSLALDIIRAYNLAGRPDQGLKPYGSFEAWSDMIRGAIAWCGLPDPNLTRKAVSERADRPGQLLTGLIEGWRQLDPDSLGLTTSEALKKLKAEGQRTHTEAANAYGSEDRYAILRQTLLEHLPAKNGDLPDAQRLGNLLGTVAERPCGGHAFTKKMVHGTAVWRVVPVDQLGQRAPEGQAP